jgi:hypothetical protein
MSIKLTLFRANVAIGAAALLLRPARRCRRRGGRGGAAATAEEAVRSQAKDSRKAKVEQGEFDGELSEQEGRLSL